MSGRVIVIGSLNIDLVTQVERHPKPGETLTGSDLVRVAGGKGANQAAAAQRAGANVAMVGHVGDDEGGRAYRSRLADLGVDVDLLVTDETRPTGTALIVVDAQGENSIVIAPGANASDRWPDTLAQALEGLTPDDVVLLQQEIPHEVSADAIRGATAAGARVLINLAPFAPLEQEVLDLVEAVIVNEHEAQQLAEAGLHAPSTITTFGAKGAGWDGEPRSGPKVPADQVIDTTGAGDAFCGALCAALAAGADHDAALDAGQESGATAVRHAGAQPDATL
ncbi:ribokinase [Kineosphaera limosa]|uniref:Ribokinase n=1 Tax=Kineosphaera limosa NBRC 100340 TaxID=1184609 RepID=K6X5N5_9MICO|nr:PfkB family carbohydrate kinase [Kineosphaera limosa]NYE02259.1 ribokinase [Kineosphaera limosa]GAB94114.1 ribokinase [Kineosphaera limosa NBRC 100340]